MPQPRLRPRKKRGRIRLVEVRTKQILTRNGSVEITRSCYSCRECGISVVPFDSQLGVTDRKRTLEVDQAITLLGVELSFPVAARTLERLTGLSVSDKTVLEVTESVGRAAQAMLDEESVSAKAAKLEPAGSVLDWRQDKLSILYVQPDGSMVPMRPEDRPNQKATPDHPGTHREAKVAAIFWGDDVTNVSPKRREVLRKRYVAMIGGVDEFKDKVWATVFGMTRSKRFQPVVLGDGAEWIKGFTEELFPDAIRIVDFYHVMERIYEVANLLHGPSSIPGRAWAKEQAERLKASKIDEVLTALATTGEQKPHKKGERQALKDKANETAAYIQKRRDYMQYASYLAQGLMIGSGIIESSHKRVIAQRLKQAGMHWTVDGANAVAHLRALHLSDGAGWDDLWKKLAAG